MTDNARSLGFDLLELADRLQIVVDDLRRGGISRQPWPIGRTIVACRPLNAAELATEYWSDSGHVITIELDDGTVLYASSDHDGNAQEDRVLEWVRAAINMRALNA